MLIVDSALVVPMSNPTRLYAPWKPSTTETFIPLLAALTTSLAGWVLINLALHFGGAA